MSKVSALFFAGWRILFFARTFLFATVAGSRRRRRRWGWLWLRGRGRLAKGLRALLLCGMIFYCATTVIRRHTNTSRKYSVIHSFTALLNKYYVCFFACDICFSSPKASYPSHFVRCYLPLGEVAMVLPKKSGERVSFSPVKASSRRKPARRSRN